MRLHTLIAISVTMCALPALAADPPIAPAPRPVPLHVTKVYAVSTLVNAADARQGERLARLVSSIVRPYSWTERGGDGTIEYYKTESSLVVTSTADVLRMIGDLLEAFNRVQSGAVQLPPTDWLVRDLRAVQNPPPVAPAPRPASQNAVFKLRNVAATDAADALIKHFAGKAPELRLQVDGSSNTLLLSAAPETLKTATDILTALDRSPTQVVISTLVVSASDEFVKASGLTVGTKPNATVFVLSARETHMFGELIRGAKGKSEIDVLSRPRLQVLDNQTGFVQVSNGDSGITFRATPRVMPDGRILLRAEAQIAEGGRTATTHSVQTTAELKPGETLVARVGDALVIVTPAIVK